MVTEGCPAVLRANERTPRARARLAGWSEADEPEGRQTLSIAGHRGMGLSCPELSADTRKIMRRWSGDASGISTRRLRPQRDHKRKRPPQGWPKSLHKWWLRTESNRRHGDFQKMVRGSDGRPKPEDALQCNDYSPQEAPQDPIRGVAWRYHGGGQHGLLLVPFDRGLSCLPALRSHRWFAETWTSWSRWSRPKTDGRLRGRRRRQSKPGGSRTLR